MKRLIYNEMLAWRHQVERKPLLLRGARQVGKTHVIRQLGKTFSQFIEINFEKTPSFAKIFELDLDPARIIREISLAIDQQIEPGHTLLFFDEVQQAPTVITALRYFYEEMPALHVIAAGSLVDFAIEHVGVPVGRISFLHMYPMSFIEFLCAKNSKQLALEIINNKPDHPFSDVIHQKALRLLGEYMAIGGMPQVVRQWISQQDVRACTTLLRDINHAYEQDFSKYANKNEIKYVDFLFKHIPHLICQRFKYSQLSPDFRKRELEPALWLLQKAGIVNPVIHSSGNGIPLGAEADFQKYKLITLDVALNQQILGLDLKDWFIQPEIALINKGNLSESFIGQELLAYSNSSDKSQLYYWHNEKKGSHAEVDYLSTHKQAVIPIEVKSGHGANLQSMRLFLQSHPGSPFGIRFSTHPYSILGNLHSYPLYAVSGSLEDKKRLITFAHSS